MSSFRQAVHRCWWSAQPAGGFPVQQGELVQLIRFDKPVVAQLRLPVPVVQLSTARQRTVQLASQDLNPSVMVASLALEAAGFLKVGSNAHDCGPWSGPPLCSPIQVRLAQQRWCGLGRRAARSGDGPEAFRPRSRESCGNDPERSRMKKPLADEPAKPCYRDSGGDRNLFYRLPNGSQRECFPPEQIVGVIRNPSDRGDSILARAIMEICAGLSSGVWKRLTAS